MNELEEEKKALEDKIQANYKAIEALETAIHWDKKKLKIVNQQIAAQAETPLQTLEKITKS